MTKEEFKQLCKTAWEKQHGFVIIDLGNKKKTTANIEVGLRSFTYQIKLIFLLKMENLKQIVNNTEPKRSFSIVINDNKTRFKTWINHQFNLIKRKIRKYRSSIWRSITHFQI